MKRFAALVAVICLIAVGCNPSALVSFVRPGPTKTVAAPTATPTPTPTPNPQAVLVNPISGGRARVTKIFFGTYVTPTDSPIVPERFTGYHTGVDFETYPDEQNTDVPIYAACTGKLLLKEWASGYGGVAAQACTINSQAVTIIYGHLRLSSITPATGTQLTAGEQFAVLGTGYSTETDGERKHLHFGIHIGTSINILGYVPVQSDLSGWLNPLNYLP